MPRITAVPVLPSTLFTVSASAASFFRGSISHPIRLLCTLRSGRHLPPRNTHYQAGATPYLGRTFTGWITPACLAHEQKTGIKNPHGKPRGIDGSKDASRAHAASRGEYVPKGIQKSHAKVEFLSGL